jgi:CheY-like chemotaxis protein
MLLLAMTGYDAPDAEAYGRAHGFDHHLVKPVDGATLRKLIADLSSRFARPAAE